MLDELVVVSSYSKDKIFDKNGRLLRVNQGGPALFINQALNKLGQSPEIIANEEFVVEITLTENGEAGQVKDLPKQSVIPERHNAKWWIISTIMDEWLINQAEDNFQKFFLDVQGYLRTKQPFESYLPENFSGLHCLKGTAEEIARLPQSVVDIQKNKLLIITHGSKGVEIYEHGKKYMIQVPRVVHSPDTIGAGDTFLAAFVSYAINGFGSVEAARKAMVYTADFLENKLNDEQFA